MKSFILFMLLTTSYSLLGQNHLEPIDRSDNRLSKYSKYLGYNLNEQEYVRVIAMPSFAPEYLISIEPSVEGNYIFFRCFEKPIYQDEALIERGLGQVIEYKQLISKELSDLIEEVIFEAISKTRYPPNQYYYLPDGRKVLLKTDFNDGETYYFDSSLFHVKRSGQLTPLQNGEIMKDLIQFVRLMRAATIDLKVHKKLYDLGSRLLIKVKKS